MVEEEMVEEEMVEEEMEAEKEEVKVVGMEAMYIRPPSVFRLPGPDYHNNLFY
jgi:hypothetical protein